MREGSLFSGYNGLGMAVSEVFGSEPAWFSEIEPGPSKILEHHWPDVPNLGDITKVDWDAVEPVDILSGGFPCQDVSAAGKRAGLHPGTRSGLWNHMAYAISKLRPRYVVAENVRGLLSAEAHSDVEPCPWCLGDGPGEPALRALGAVLADLGELGYDAQWCGLRAADVGAPHPRFRVFLLARDTANVLGERSRAVRGIGTGDARPAGSASGSTTEDPDVSTGSERRLTAPGQAEVRRSWPHARGRGGVPVADATGYGWDEGRPESAREFGGSDAAERSRASANSDSDEQPWQREQQRGTTPAGGGAPAAWGDYGNAITRWERVIGRLAPPPTEANTKGAQRLSPAFVEWMMGLPSGHVVDVPGLDRNAQLKALGNGVVPQQALAALRHLAAVAA